MDLTVVVGTYGHPEWQRLARTRAIPSAEAECLPVAHVHGETLARARNAGLAQVRSEWVVFLDADDELEPGFLEGVAAADGDIRAPRVRYVTGTVGEAVFPRVVGHDHDCSAECLPDGNWIVVGAPVRTELVREAGGFQPWPIWEDWALWYRLWSLGATVGRAPAAVYRAHVRPGSRNAGVSRDERRSVRAAIQRAAVAP